jgi:transcriptional regulator with XRE-family HTH domain
MGIFRRISEMVPKNIIGERVRRGRKKARPRITQIDLAARLQTLGLQVDQAAISRIESGSHEVTDVEVAMIAKALGVTVGWLFGESESP